jgi:hypothetical protein
MGLKYEKSRGVISNLKVKCEYLLDNRLCESLTDDQEGQALRRETCVNPSRNTCCYLCDDQKTCEISCDYLGKPDDVPKSEVSGENADPETDACLQALERLSTQFTEGTIDRQFYSRSLSTIAAALDSVRAVLNSEEKKNHDTEPENVIDQSSDLIMQKEKITASLVLPDSSTLPIEKMRIIRREDLARFVSANESWWISKEHCVIFQDRHLFYIQDTGSINGTKLNGLNITGKGKNEIRDGDEITIADKVKLRFAVLSSSNR